MALPARPYRAEREGLSLNSRHRSRGFSGATMDRSGLRQLLADIAQAQREACEAFIASQRHEGWILPACRLWRRRLLRRDHGSAALQRPLVDITAGRASAIRSAASSRTSSPAVRYWNKARQRYHRLSARYS